MDYEVDDIRFLRCNFVYDIKNIINNNIKKMTQGMTENEIKAFEMGVGNILGILEAFYEPEENTEIIIYDKSVTTSEEADIDEILERINKE